MTRQRANWKGMNWIRQEKRFAIYQRDGMACVYCLSTVEQVTLTLDHLLPCELGGDNETRNLVTACRCCNCAKGKKTLRQFLAHLKQIGQDAAAIRNRIRRNIRRRINYGRR